MKQTKYVDFIFSLSLQISALMDKFENQFETLDVQTAQMEDTMGNTTTLTTPQVISTVLLQAGNSTLILSINSNIESSKHILFALVGP